MSKSWRVVGLAAKVLDSWVKQATAMRMGFLRGDGDEPGAGAVDGLRRRVVGFCC